MKHCGNDVEKARVICPFFRRFSGDGRIIVCEGAVRGAENGVIFRREEERRRYTASLCSTFGYGRCPVARAVESKLGE